jgi:hypothetical protein
MMVFCIFLSSLENYAFSFYNQVLFFFICDKMFRFRRSLPQFLRKNSFLTRLKNKLLQDDEEEKQIIPH